MATLWRDRQPIGERLSKHPAILIVGVAALFFTAGYVITQHQVGQVQTKLGATELALAAVRQQKADELAAIHRRLSSLEAGAAEKDAVISQLQKQLTELEERRSREIAERDRRIAELEAGRKAVARVSYRPAHTRKSDGLREAGFAGNACCAAVARSTPVTDAAVAPNSGEVGRAKIVPFPIKFIIGIGTAVESIIKDAPTQLFFAGGVPSVDPAPHVHNDSPATTW